MVNPADKTTVTELALYVKSALNIQAFWTARWIDLTGARLRGFDDAFHFWSAPWRRFPRASMRGMSKLVYSVHIEPLPKGGFYITVPALPECRTTATTFNVAIKTAKTQIEKCVKALARAGKPIPMESQTVRPLCLPIRASLPKKARVVLASQLKVKS